MGTIFINTRTGEVKERCAFVRRDGSMVRWIWRPSFEENPKEWTPIGEVDHRFQPHNWGYVKAFCHLHKRWEGHAGPYSPTIWDLVWQEAIEKLGRCDTAELVAGWVASRRTQRDLEDLTHRLIEAASGLAPSKELEAKLIEVVDKWEKEKIALKRQKRREYARRWRERNREYLELYRSEYQLRRAKARKLAQALQEEGVNVEIRGVTLIVNGKGVRVEL